MAYSRECKSSFSLFPSHPDKRTPQCWGESHRARTGGLPTCRVWVLADGFPTMSQARGVANYQRRRGGLPPLLPTVLCVWGGWYPQSCKIFKIPLDRLLAQALQNEDGCSQEILIKLIHCFFFQSCNAYIHYTLIQYN